MAWAVDTGSALKWACQSCTLQVGPEQLGSAVKTLKVYSTQDPAAGASSSSLLSGQGLLELLPMIKTLTSTGLELVTRESPCMAGQ